jgi:hypothetical protein
VNLRVVTGSVGLACLLTVALALFLGSTVRRCDERSSNVVIWDCGSNTGGKPSPLAAGR